MAKTTTTHAAPKLTVTGVALTTHDDPSWVVTYEGPDGEGVIDIHCASYEADPDAYRKRFPEAVEAIEATRD